MMYRKHGNMKTMVQMLLVVLGLFWCLRVSQAITCNECTSVPGSITCGEPYVQKKTCTDKREDAVCYKTKIRKDGKLMIYWCDICRNFGNKSRMSVTVRVCATVRVLFTTRC